MAKPKLVSMALTPEERAAMGYGGGPAVPAKMKDDGPLYPWGLTLNLDDASLRKLGVKPGSIDVENGMMLVARVHVAGHNVDARVKDGEVIEEQRVSLEIRELALGPVEKETDDDAAAALYGKG